VEILIAISIYKSRIFFEDSKRLYRLSAQNGEIIFKKMPPR
jgi:uncharacterized protein YegP (UPF0339 family)